MSAGGGGVTQVLWTTQSLVDHLEEGEDDAGAAGEDSPAAGDSPRGRGGGGPGGGGQVGGGSLGQGAAHGGGGRTVGRQYCIQDRKSVGGGWRESITPAVSETDRARFGRI